MTGSNPDIRCFRKGWKQKIGKFTKVFVKGTDYERGLQFGTLMAAEIKIAVKGFIWYIINATPQIPYILKWSKRWLPLLVKPLVFFIYRKSVAERIKKYPEWMRTELEGMARGARIHLFFLQFMNSIADETNLLGDEDLFFSRPLQSCCSFAFTGKDGNIYHGKNLDGVPFVEFVDTMCFQQREDENGDWFAIIGPPGRLDLYEFGMNSHGLSMALTGRFFRGKRASKLALTNAVELKILRFAKNLEDLQKIYHTKTGFDRSDCLLISSYRDRDYRLFEVTPIGAAATPSRDGRLFNTNTYVHQAFHKYNKHWGNIYDNQFCDPRYKRLGALMAGNPGNLEDAFNILSDTVQPGFEQRIFFGQATINRFITYVSALMIRGSSSPGVWIARAHTYSALQEFSFFDFSDQPQKKPVIRPANPIINAPGFSDFEQYIRIRDSKYDVSLDRQINQVEKLLRKEPDNPIYILFTAQGYFKNKKWRAAVQVLEDHPLEWAADYWYCFGKCQIELGEYAQAREKFLKAVNLPGIDGFNQHTETVCVVQMVKVNEKLGLTGEVKRWQKKLADLQAKFATPNIGMPDYPYINNIVEQLEDLIL